MAIVVVNTAAAATNVLLYSFIMTVKLLGVTFLHWLVLLLLVRSLINKLFYISYHKLYQPETL